MSEHKPTLLIIDDSPESIRLLADLLSDVGKVLFTRTGRGVYPLLEKQTIDMILLEVNLPDASGFEICQRLMNNRYHQHIQVVFVTARAGTEDENLGLSLGAMDYITKPIDPVSLRHRVINHLKHTHLRHELSELMTHDPLTDMGNRKLFFERLASLLPACQRQQRKCSLIVFDIDHFKRINSTFGLLVADQTLIQTAESVRAQIPARDLFFRLGDDEFAVILPDTDLNSSHLLAECLRVNIGETLQGIGNDRFLLTACFGVAAAQSGEVYSSFYLRADQALQNAKKRGRNRVDMALPA